MRLFAVCLLALALLASPALAQEYAYGGTGEEALLESLYEDAAAYLAEAGVSEPDAGTGRAAQYDQCINALVLDAWDHRGSQTAGQALVENPAFRRRLNQLKLTEPVPDSGTGIGG